MDLLQGWIYNGGLRGFIQTPLSRHLVAGRCGGGGGGGGGA